MKKIILFTVLISCLSLKAQHKVAEKVAELQSLHANFVSVSVLSANPNAINHDVGRVVEGATLATLQTDKITDIVVNHYDYLELQIPYQNQTIAVVLYQINPFLEGFHVDSNKIQSIAYQKGVHYRGIVKGDATSVASFNFFNGECNGIVSGRSLGNLVIGKLDKRANKTDYIVYSDARMNVLNPFDCHTKEYALTPKTGETNKKANSDRCVALYYEVDNDLYLANNSDIGATTNWMASVFNNVQTVYANDGISVGLKSMYVWTTPDPYASTGDDSNKHLESFGATRPIFDGDVGQLVSMDSGALGGIAYPDTICTEYNYSYADVDLSYNSVPVYSWTVNVIAHELGHLLGSPHTHACLWNGNDTAIDGCATSYDATLAEGDCAIGPIPNAEVKGTIMSYCHVLSGVGINLANGFGPQPRALILDRVNSRTCLSADCLSACSNMVTDITASNVTTGGATITWDDLADAESWQIAVEPANSPTKTWTTVTEKTFDVSELYANSYYVIRIKPLCNVDVMVREQLFATSASDFCSGVAFTDTGSTLYTYADMESYVRTMTPSDPSSKIKVTFNSFDLEKDYDYLYIYNGASTVPENLLTPDGLTGTDLPGTYTSTAADGSLTFKFTSDGATAAEGWDAVISCSESLGLTGNAFVDYSYYPNPTNGKVTIASKGIISEIKVYNIEGRLLFSQKVNELTANVDMVQFASGTYFFKLKLDNKEANFKVLKM